MKLAPVQPGNPENQDLILMQDGDRRDLLLLNDGRPRRSIFIASLYWRGELSFLPKIARENLRQLEIFQFDAGRFC